MDNARIHSKDLAVPSYGSLLWQRLHSAIHDQLASKLAVPSYGSLLWQHRSPSIALLILACSCSTLLRVYTLATHQHDNNISLNIDLQYPPTGLSSGNQTADQAKRS